MACSASPALGYTGVAVTSAHLGNQGGFICPLARGETKSQRDSCPQGHTACHGLFPVSPKMVPAQPWAGPHGYFCFPCSEIEDVSTDQLHLDIWYKPCALQAGGVGASGLRVVGGGTQGWAGLDKPAAPLPQGP